MNFSVYEQFSAIFTPFGLSPSIIFLALFVVPSSFFCFTSHSLLISCISFVRSALIDVRISPTQSCVIDSDHLRRLCRTALLTISKSPSVLNFFLCCLPALYPAFNFYPLSSRRLPAVSKAASCRCTYRMPLNVSSVYNGCGACSASGSAFVVHPGSAVRPSFVSYSLIHCLRSPRHGYVQQT